MNNNLSIQNLPMPSSSSSAESRLRGSSTTVNMASKSQQQQRPSNEQSTSAHRGRYGRSGRGRDGQAFKYDSSNRAVNRNSQDALAQEGSGQNESTQIQACVTANNGHLAARDNNQKSAHSRGGRGKYRQRQQTNQIIDSLDGLDIDLVESIASTSSIDKPMTSGKSRHVTNNRKVNLTHLLNYDRRQRGDRHRNLSYTDNNSAGSFPRNSLHYRDFGAHKFSKQQFLQANCQFVVLDGHDYTVHKVDPDWPVDWDCIEEVKFRQIASTETTCPICLEPPVAAKITRCGHIYCWTCMLHYLSLSDENCRQCPICFEPVYRGDLRSVVSQSFTNHAVGEEIIMKLMVRRKGCVEVEPYWREFMQRSNIEMGMNESDNFESKEHYCSQANLVIVDPLTVIAKIAQREKDELMMKLELDRDEPEVCFIEQAMDRLNKRIERLHRMATDESRIRGQATHSQGAESMQTNADSPSKNYLFYQSYDGQHIYLNPFSTKILCHEYRNLENCPLEIRAEILQMDWVSMSEVWRKRFKYLEHLPLTCEFRLIEVDFEKSNLVSRETYQAFEEQIKMRAKERERRRREERKREKIIQVEQNRKIYGIQPSLKINLNNIEQFPSVSDERYLGLTKLRNKDRASDENLSSDDENFLDVQDTTTSTSIIPEGGGPSSNCLDTYDEPTLGDMTTGVALSFRDIQLEEAAKEAKSKVKGGINKQTSAWAGKRQGSAANTQSSFAQLLVDAKKSQKEWTRNVSSAAVSSSNAHQGSISHFSSSQRPNNSAGSDDGGEELRAPPCEFTISDFIDMNIVSGAGGKRGKGKHKNANNKKG